MKGRIRLAKGDITQIEVDAVVNAANTKLLGGGGVDGAIHRAAGPDLLAECRQLGGCRTGEAKITAGYRLPAKWVIHTVGPVWRGGRSGERELLASCYRSSLALAEARECPVVAFPAISCGVYGYPIEEACEVALQATRDYLTESPIPEIVIFVLYSIDDYLVYEKQLEDLARRSNA
jgi:O-acetyl-ADP-ribose deacetylase (regulator of RNase III)